MATNQVVGGSNPSGRANNHSKDQQLTASGPFFRPGVPVAGTNLGQIRDNGTSRPWRHALDSTSWHRDTYHTLQPARRTEDRACQTTAGMRLRLPVAHPPPIRTHFIRPPKGIRRFAIDPHALNTRARPIATPPPHAPLSENPSPCDHSVRPGCPHGPLAKAAGSAVKSHPPHRTNPRPTPHPPCRSRPCVISTSFSSSKSTRCDFVYQTHHPRPVRTHIKSSPILNRQTETLAYSGFCG